MRAGGGLAAEGCADPATAAAVGRLPGGVQRIGAHAVPLVVQKYGGSSVADADRIRRVAARIVDTRKGGNDVVVVVSAMGDTTDELLELAEQVSPLPPGRELDMLLTAGERISMALLAMAIASLGLEARSFTGSQAGVITDSVHGKARIIDVTPGRIRGALDDGAVAIVAGFQGVSQDTKDITTLGRGGSDTTAVALAAALSAEVCEIYTDVDGVYTADPRLVPTARKLDRISYEEMLEQAIISGVAHDRSEAKVTVVGVPDKPGNAASILRALADADVNIDMIVQNTSVAATGRTDITFTVPTADGTPAMAALTKVQPQVGFESLLYDDHIGKVSLVGAGMRSHPGVSATFLGALADAGVNVEIISTSEIRISVVCRDVDVPAAVAAVHAAFELEAAGDSPAMVYGGSGR